MRLFYQSFGVSRQSREGAYGQLLTRIVESAASPGTVISINGLGPTRALADQYRYLELIDSVEVMENGLRAQEEGYDAFLVGNIFEPGLHQLRELLTIPVIGLRESSVHVACMMGPTFSLVNVNPKFVRPILEGIQLQGLSSRMVSIEKLEVERPGVFDLALRDPAIKGEIVEQFMAAARRGLDSGAEVIIPAGGSLMALLTDAGVNQVDGAPVLNGIVALVKCAEMAVQIARLTGGFTSKRMMYAPPAGKLLADVRESYGAQVYPGA